jgi:hypothetical protein
LKAKFQLLGTSIMEARLYSSQLAALETHFVSYKVFQLYKLEFVNSDFSRQPDAATAAAIFLRLLHLLHLLHLHQLHIMHHKRTSWHHILLLAMQVPVSAGDAGCYARVCKGSKGLLPALLGSHQDAVPGPGLPGQESLCPPGGRPPPPAAPGASQSSCCSGGDCSLGCHLCGALSFPPPQVSLSL